MCHYDVLYCMDTAQQGLLVDEAFQIANSASHRRFYSHDPKLQLAHFAETDEKTKSTLAEKCDRR